MRNLLIISSVISIISCLSEKATQNISKVNIFEKPLKGVDVPLQKSLVSATKGDTIFFENGTRIIIPENAFIDSLGNPIKGNVEISFQEYHTEAEVILSGIPMQYDSAGSEYTLETDGMFKINGSQNGSKVKIYPNKSLKVKTKSYKEDTPCFNYYTQNEDGSWSYQLSKERKINTEKTIEQEIAKIKPIDEKSVGIDFRVNTKKYPELAGLNNISWIYNGNKPDTLNFKLLSKIIWNDFDLQKTDESLYSYLLIGRQKNNKFKIPVTLAFSEDELATVKTLITKKIKEDELAYYKLKTEAEREAVINNFGTFNWDRCVADEMIVIDSYLRFEKSIKYFYVINKSSKYKFVNKYKYNDLNTLKILKRGRVGIIAFLEEEGKVAYAFDNTINTAINQRGTIDLTHHNRKIKRSADLQELIDLI